jgi:hypothetical protein
MVQIKRTKTSLGWAYRVYVDGEYLCTGLTRESARESVPRMLAIYEKALRRKDADFYSAATGSSSGSSGSV